MKKCDNCKQKFEDDEVFKHPFDERGLLGLHHLCSLCYDKACVEKDYKVFISENGDRLYLDEKNDELLFYFKNCVYYFRGKLDDENKMICSFYDKLIADEAYIMYKATMTKLGREAKKISEMKKIIIKQGKRDDEKVILYTNVKDKRDLPEKYQTKNVIVILKDGTTQSILK